MFYLKTFESCFFIVVT